MKRALLLFHFNLDICVCVCVIAKWPTSVQRLSFRRAFQCCCRCQVTFAADAPVQSPDARLHVARAQPARLGQAIILSDPPDAPAEVLHRAIRHSARVFPVREIPAGAVLGSQRTRSALANAVDSLRARRR